MKIKVLIVDDHSLIITGIKKIVNRIKNINVVGTANSGKEALSILENSSIDIIITDVEMNEIDGIELTKITKRKYPHIKIIAITLHSEPWIITKLINADIDAIIIKSKTDCQEIQQAFNSIQANKKYYSEEVKENFFGHTDNTNSTPNITFREKEILILICKEYTTQKIAEHLHIVESTVETHRRNLFSKLKVKSQSGLVREAIRFGFYKFE